MSNVAFRTSATAKFMRKKFVTDLVLELDITIQTIIRFPTNDVAIMTTATVVHMQRPKGVTVWNDGSGHSEYENEKYENEDASMTISR